MALTPARRARMKKWGKRAAFGVLAASAAFGADRWLDRDLKQDIKKQEMEMRARKDNPSVTDMLEVLSDNDFSKAINIGDKVMQRAAKKGINLRIAGRRLMDAYREEARPEEREEIERIADRYKDSLERYIRHLENGYPIRRNLTRGAVLLGILLGIGVYKRDTRIRAQMKR